MARVQRICPANGTVEQAMHPGNPGFAAKPLISLLFLLIFLIRGSAACNGSLCRLGCDEIAHACRESGLNDTPAAQNVRARSHVLLAEAAAGIGLSSQRQLAGGKSSRTKSGCNHGYEQRGFGSFSHDSSLIE
jgi:hypothetical protein